MPGVIIDTSVWLQALRVPDSIERQEVDRLIEDRTAVLVGIVFAEILRGARDETQLLDLEERLGALDFLESDKETWRQAGRLLYELKRRGQVIPLADALIAIQALEADCEVYARDEHFQRVPGLRLYQAGEGQ